MYQVILLFKILEAIAGLICMVNHALGFSIKEEPLPHILLFCGTFFGFTLISLITAASLIIGAAPPVFLEIIVNIIAATLYFVSSIIGMLYAERDFHLMYLSDFEEPLHSYFVYSRAQSVGALFAGAVHLLNAVLAFDVAFLTPIDAEQQLSESSGTESEDNTSLERRKIHLYFFGKYFEQKLCRFKWFHELCHRREPISTSFLFRKGRAFHILNQTSSASQTKGRKGRKTSRTGLTRIGLPYKDYTTETESDIKTTNLQTPNLESFHEQHTSPHFPPGATEFEKFSLQNKVEQRPRTSNKTLQPSTLNKSMPNISETSLTDPFETAPESNKKLEREKKEISPELETKMKDSSGIKSIKEQESQPKDPSPAIMREDDIEPEIPPTKMELSQRKQKDSPEPKSEDFTEIKSSSSTAVKFKPSLTDIEDFKSASSDDQSNTTELQFQTPKGSFDDTDKKDDKAEPSSKSKPK